jgi:YidC/Oxa1 family membrane protein insertase
MTTLIVAVLAFLDQNLGGSLGAAIMALSLAVRIALLPLTLRLARRARRTQAIVRSIQPELAALKRRFEKKPERLMEETMKLYKEHEISPFDVTTIVGGFVQWPVFAMLYGAIKRSLKASRAFLWIRSLSAPDALLTALILALTALTAFCMPSMSEHARTSMIAIQVVITALIVWKLAAGLGLYWVASNLVGFIQALWLRRDVRSGAGGA